MFFKNFNVKFIVGITITPLTPKPTAIMKRALSATAILSLLAQLSSAQQIPYTGAIFQKTVEYNKHAVMVRYMDGTPAHGTDNYENKSRAELLLFGKCNSTLEFSTEPSFEGARGMRLVDDNGNDGCRIEVRYISNYDQVQRTLQEKYSVARVNLDGLTVAERLAAEEKLRSTPDRNKLRQEEEFASYKVKSASVSVSNGFTDKLYGTVHSAIGRIKSSGVKQIVFDGTNYTLRCVVDDDLWTLTMHCPRGYYLSLSELLDDMAKDIIAGKFDEDTYAGKLDSIQ